MIYHKIAHFALNNNHSLTL